MAVHKRNGNRNAVHPMPGGKFIFCLSQSSSVPAHKLKLNGSLLSPSANERRLCGREHALWCNGWSPSPTPYATQSWFRLVCRIVCSMMQKRAAWSQQKPKENMVPIRSLFAFAFRSCSLQFAVCREGVWIIYINMSCVFNIGDFLRLSDPCEEMARDALCVENHLSGKNEVDIGKSNEANE